MVSGDTWFAKPAYGRVNMWNSSSTRPFAAIFMFLLLVGACGHEAEPLVAPTHIAEPTLAVLAAHTTGSARESINDLGQFSLQNGDAEVTEARATEIAVAAVRTYGRNHLSYLQVTRGGEIDLSQLHPSPRVFFAKNPWQFEEGTAIKVQKTFGSFFLVTLVDRTGQPTVSVAVPAQSQDISIDGEGRLVAGDLAGLFMTGIRRDAETSLPLSPERATVAVARATGARVATPPELVLRAPGFIPQLALWKLTLDREVPVLGSDGAGFRARDLYVDHAGRLYIARRSQPATVGIDGPDGKPVTLVRRDGRATAFVQVSTSSIGGGV